MRIAAALLALVVGGCAAGVAPAADGPPIPLVNAGFEAGMDGAGNPEGWSTTQHAGPSAYAFALDRSTSRSGGSSLRIDNVQAGVFGAIVQSVPAGDRAGATLVFTVWLKTHDVRGNAFGVGAVPTLQAKRGGAILASSDFTTAAVNGTTDWTRRDVTLRLPPGTETVEVGAMLTGSGSVWVDDAILRLPREAR